MGENLSFDRFRPSQLVYVELDSNNGGMLLSASEEGFCFRAVTPLRTSGSVAFAFLLDGKTRLEGKGKMVWSEEEGKKGGILFTEVTPQFRREFESWLRRKESRKGIAESKPESKPGGPPSPALIPESKPNLPGVRPKVNTAPPAEAAPAPPLRQLPPSEIPREPSSVPLLEDLERALKKAALRPENPRAAIAPVSLPLPAPQDPSVEETNEGPPPLVPPSEIKAEENPQPDASLSVPETPILEQPATLPAPVIRAEAPSETVPVKEAGEEPEKIPESPAADTMEKVARGFRAEFVPESRATEGKAAAPPEIPASQEKEFAAQLPRVALNVAAPPVDLHSQPASSQPESSASQIEQAAQARSEALAAKVEEAESKPKIAAADNTTPVISPPAEQEETLVEAKIVQKPEEADVVPEPGTVPQASTVARRYWGRAAAAAFVGVCIGWTLALLAMDFRKPIGEGLIGLGQKIAGEETPAGTSLPAKSPKENSVPPPSAPQPAGESAATPNSIRAEQPDISAKQATGESGKGEANDVGNAGVSSPDKTGNAAANPIPEKAAPQKGISATGQAEFEEARKILRGNHRQRDMEKAVELLLAGVSRGNVRAEVTLGDLYARGDGVPKDCGQARTLLEAAVKRGSPEARQFLGKLKSEGCP